MSKKTRKKMPTAPLTARSRTTSKVSSKAPAKPSPRTSSKASSKPAAKTSAKTTSKTSKTVSVKKSSAKPATAAPKGSILAEGQMAPAFDLPRDGGERLSLRDYAGRKLVLFFYPRADTPGCTREAMDFTRLAKDFAAAGTDVVGVSADPVKAQDSFKNKHKLKTPLVSDEQKEMLAAYGAWGEKSMYGKSFLGVLRTTVLIGPDGKILHIWRNVKVDGHADEVLETARSV